jgi:hypothetical protein
MLSIGFLDSQKAENFKQFRKKVILIVCIYIRTESEYRSKISKWV